MPLDEVDQGEADAYAPVANGYQHRWRGVFDPIAARLSMRADRLSADLTVMPMIASTEYRNYIDLVGKAKISPDATDRHPGTLVHAAMAIDMQSPLFIRGRDVAASIINVSPRVAFGWFGGSVSAYLDDDPFWAELAAAEKAPDFMEAHWNRIPVALQADVKDGVTLALFLAGLRAYVDQAAPNLTVWETREHQGQKYVRVSETENARPGSQGPKIAIYYYPSPRSLTISPNEDVVKRAIDRQAGKAKPGDKPAPWLGESLALQVNRGGFDVLGQSARTEFREELQVRSWSNLPILNGRWKRQHPDARESVAVHEAVWNTTLVDPGGGRYTWNPRWSTAGIGRLRPPRRARADNEQNAPTSRFQSVGLGLYFEDGGLRARTEVELRPRP